MSYTTKTNENSSEIPMNKPNPNPMNKLEQVCYIHLKNVYQAYKDDENQDEDWFVDTFLHEATNNWGDDDYSKLDINNVG